MTETNGLRSLEQALADIREKYNQTPEGSRERAELERMIRVLEAEIERRKGLTLAWSRAGSLVRPFEIVATDFLKRAV